MELSASPRFPRPRHITHERGKGSSSQRIILTGGSRQTPPARRGPTEGCTAHTTPGMANGHVRRPLPPGPPPTSSQAPPPAHANRALVTRAQSLPSRWSAVATVARTKELKKRHGVCQERIVSSVLEAVSLASGSSLARATSHALATPPPHASHNTPHTHTHIRSRALRSTLSAAATLRPRMELERAHAVG